MRGKNPKRAPEKGNGDTLFVQEVFATLQGEGLYAGWPAVFIRLGGCNLACHFCDTQFEDFSEIPRDEILARVTQLAAPDGTRMCELVVITGGEPLRQEIAPLCDALIAEGFLVQIETNGTLFRTLPDAVQVICSPKAVDGKYYPLRPDILARSNALKFLISETTSPYQHVPFTAPHCPTYVQPMDEYDAVQNKQNQQLALRLAQQHGYRLSLQTHKILEIP
jgi:7-carboxy-7-deazaguanine synthase